ncbi:transcription factor myc2 [Quercus suber]|uniref:Transcription factor myc2 n=1 Tax=Quercus suber TaxID=58331 RepID=A0AAW0IPK3_QUESU
MLYDQWAPSGESSVSKPRDHQVSGDHSSRDHKPQRTTTLSFSSIPFPNPKVPQSHMLLEQDNNNKKKCCLMLGPLFHYDPNFVANEEVRVGLYEVIERMCPTTLERCRIDLQLEKFDKAEGLFGKEMAILTRTKKQPVYLYILLHSHIHSITLSPSSHRCQQPKSAPVAGTPTATSNLDVIYINLPHKLLCKIGLKTSPVAAGDCSQGELQAALQKLIEEVRHSWTYAIMWGLSYDHSGMPFLRWADGYYKGSDDYHMETNNRTEKPLSVVLEEQEILASATDEEDEIVMGRPNQLRGGEHDELTRDDSFEEIYQMLATLPPMTEKHQACAPEQQTQVSESDVVPGGGNKYENEGTVPMDFE